MSTGVVISQPGKGQRGEEMAMMHQPPMGVVVPAGLPAGLAYLAGLEEIRIRQQLELLEVVVGWERNNRYQICNNQDQQFMFAKEDTDCLTRQCCGVMRPFVMNITDNQGLQLIQLHRPFRCQGSWCWCCCLQELEIQSPPGVTVGKVEEVWTCWVPRYRIVDNSGGVIFNIVGDCCYCKCCTDVVFTVFEGSDESQEVGQIRKHWGGCSEIFGAANNFTVHFTRNMDLMRKTLLFAGTFLIDFNYFERRGNN